MPKRQPTLHRAYRGTGRIGSTDPFPKHNRLAVLPDPDRTHPHQYAIISRLPLHPHHGLRGYKRGYGENHRDLYAYRFVSWMTAARVAHEIVASGRTIWEAGE
jgi:hypothetical protein